MLMIIHGMFHRDFSFPRTRRKCINVEGMVQNMKHHEQNLIQSVCRNLVFLARYLSPSLFLTPGFVSDLWCKVPKASDDMHLWIWKSENRNWEIIKQAPEMKSFVWAQGGWCQGYNSGRTSWVSFHPRFHTQFQNQEATRMVQNPKSSGS